MALLFAFFLRQVRYLCEPAWTDSVVTVYPSGSTASDVCKLAPNNTSYLGIESFAILNLWKIFLRTQNLCPSVEETSSLFDAHFLDKASQTEGGLLPFLRNLGPSPPCHVVSWWGRNPFL